MKRSPDDGSLVIEYANLLEKAGRACGCRTGAARPAREGPARRERAQLARLHAGRSRSAARRSRRPRAARAEGGAGEPLVPRQPRLGLLPAGQARSRRSRRSRKRRRKCRRARSSRTTSATSASSSSGLPTRSRRGSARSRGDGDSIDSAAIEKKMQDARSRVRQVAPRRACAPRHAPCLLAACCAAALQRRPRAAALHARRAPDRRRHPLPRLHHALHRSNGRHAGHLTSLSASIRLSGRAGSTKFAARIDSGFAAPAQVRLEGFPRVNFGGKPFFILVAVGAETTLLMPRDARVLRAARRPPPIVEALAGVALGPADSALDRLRMRVPDLAAVGQAARSARLGGGRRGGRIGVPSPDRWPLAGCRCAARGLTVTYSILLPEAPRRFGSGWSTRRDTRLLISRWACRNSRSIRRSTPRRSRSRCPVTARRSTLERTAPRRPAR